MITSSRSDFLIVRGLRYHVRIWGAPDAPPLFLLHGFMDTSATFDPVASILAEERRILAPDWRGFGLTEWAQDGYWFPEYLADLEAIVEHYASGSPFDMAGHSMGGQAAALFAGLRPDRVKRLALLDSLMLADQKANTAVDRYRRWMDEVRKPTRAPTYASFDQLAGRIRAKHPKLTPEGAAFVARCWGAEAPGGRIELLSDPKHLRHGPKPYRQDESDAIWSKITAQVLFLDGAESPHRKGLSASELRRRRGQFKKRQQAQVPKAGHMLHFDAPEDTARLLARFFN